MPFEQVHSVESGDVDFDSFGMAPWDVGGMHSCTHSEPFLTIMLQWLIRNHTQTQSDYDNVYGKWT